MPKNTQITVEFGFGEGRILEELYMAQHDLLIAKSMLDQVESVLADGKSADPVLLIGYWTAALVRYARCFDRTKRRKTKLPASIFDNKPGATDAHNHYIKLRHEHAAHDGRPKDWSKVGVVVSYDDEGTPNVPAAVVTFMINTPSATDVSTLRNLIGDAITHLKGKIEKSTTGLVEAARRVGIERLERMPKLEMDMGQGPKPIEVKLGHAPAEVPNE